MPPKIKPEVKLSKLINRMVEDAYAIQELTKELILLGDTTVVDVFKDIHKSPLLDAADTLEESIGPINNQIKTLATILYVKDMEAISPVNNLPWRELANSKPVEAIKLLRESISRLDVSDAKRVIDAYRLNPF